jgi:FkbM family methyltransferase
MYSQNREQQFIIDYFGNTIGTFLDIGANVGAFTYSILEKNPKAVYCFEPNVSIFETLSLNVGKSKNVTCINKAIIDKDGEALVFGLYCNDDRVLCLRVPCRQDRAEVYAME